MVDRTGSHAPAPSDSGTLESVKKTVDNVLWVIATGSTVAGFVISAGGPAGFLTKVGLFGAACYVGVWPAVPLVLGVVWLFDHYFRRDITDDALAILLCGLVLIAGWLIYRAVFAGVDDLDTFARVFFAVVGVAVLAAPVGLLIYRKGSTPKSG